MPFLAEHHHPIPTTDILSWTFDNYKHDWDKPIYIDARDHTHSFSARQARILIRQLVAGFRAIGLKRGDCVCIHSFNDVCYPLFFLGVLAAGGIFAGTNPAYTAHELAHTLKTAKVKWVLTAPDLLEPVLKAVGSVEGLGRDRVLIFNPNGEKAPSGYKQWKDLLQYGEQDWVRFDDLNTAKSTEAARLFSSGTTGLPKAATLSHYNLIAQHTLVFEATEHPWIGSRLIALPMFHAATAPSAFCTPLRASEQAYVMARFELEPWFEAMEKYQITDLTVVPPIVILLINSPLNKKYSLKSVRAAKCGAAPLDKGPQARLQALLAPDAPFTQVWGMTETSCISSMFDWREHDVTGSVGRMLPGVDAKLVDDDGKDVSEQGCRGELCVRGAIVINGYFENPEANARDWDKEGYFHTGDIAYRDPGTKLWYIVDRKKELIKVRGFQVAPPELEGVLLGHPDIVDAAVIGMILVRDGSELPRAYIVRRPGSGEALTTADVHKYMRERLASYKMLEGGVVFTDLIPKNASGKILKRLLRERAEKEMGPKL